MAEVKVRLDKAMGTSLIVLYGLACDVRANRPVLGDTMAAQAFEKVDYDFASLKFSPRNLRRQNKLVNPRDCAAPTRSVA